MFPLMKTVCQLTIGISSNVGQKTLSKPSFNCDIKIYLMHGLQIFIDY